MTMKFLAPFAAAGLAAFLGFSGAAFADGEPSTKDLTLEQNKIAEVQLPDDYHADKPDRLKIKAWVDQKDSIFLINDTVRLFVQANQDVYISVFNVGASGTITRLYPNDFQPSVKIPADTIVEIPGENAPVKIKATGPTGVELIKVIASTAPLEVVKADMLAPAGPYRSVKEGTTTLSRDLQLVAEEAEEEPDYEIAFYDKVIKTVNKLGGND